MADNEYSPTDALVGRVKEHYDAKEATASIAETVAENSRKKARGRPFEKGVSGNPGGRPKGVVDYIKSRTDDYADILEFLMKVAKGEEINGQRPTLRERFDASRELLDRSVGKPTQVVVETSDDTAKQVLAAMQKALKERTRGDVEAGGESAELPENVSPLDVMKRKGRGDRH